MVEFFETPCPTLLGKCGPSHWGFLCKLCVDNPNSDPDYDRVETMEQRLVHIRQSRGCVRRERRERSSIIMGDWGNDLDLGLDAISIWRYLFRRDLLISLSLWNGNQGS